MEDYFDYYCYGYYYSVLTSIVVLVVHYALAVEWASRSVAIAGWRVQCAKRLLNKDAMHMSLQSFVVSILLATMVFEMSVGKGVSNKPTAIIDTRSCLLG